MPIPMNTEAVSTCQSSAWNATTERPATMISTWHASAVWRFCTRVASTDETNMAESAIHSGMMPMHIWTAAMFASGKLFAIEDKMGTGTSIPIMHIAAE